jgi:hypothetical protein
MTAAMARDENPPFNRGETFFGVGGVVNTVNQDPLQLIGHDWEFEDIIWSLAGTVGAKQLRTQRRVTCRVVKNVSGINLLPSRAVNMQTTGADGRTFENSVDGYASASGAFVGGIVDEWLPAAGVAPNDFFYIVTKGPTTCLTDLAAGATDVFTVGMIVAALTAATSQATTAGRVYPQDLTGATSVLGLQIQNAIGRALSAATTANTNSLLLVDVRSFF